MVRIVEITDSPQKEAAPPIKGTPSKINISSKKKKHVAFSDSTKQTSAEDQEDKKIVFKTRKIINSPIFWCSLALARVYLAVIQTSYIHPDEFHQSLQVTANDILNIDAQKPWEYSVSNPIRSVTFSFLVSLPFYILKYLSPLFNFMFGIEILTPYVLLVAPRLFMTLLSFIADACMYQIARRCYLRPWQCVEVFAGSYIMLIYSTRTFSNTVELILMAILLWRVCISIIDSTKIIRKESLLQDLYENVTDIQDKVKLVRMKSKLPRYNYVDSFVISVVVTYGVFVRPTFVIYSFIPVAYWLQRGVVTGELDFSYFHLRCLSLLPGVVVTFFGCLLADSFYYGSLSYQELLFGNVSAASFTVTPYNFFLYNTNSKNLETHGVHPWYLNILVNLPLLHGVLALIGLWTFSKYIVNLTMNRISRKPKFYSMTTMLLFSFVFPVFILSYSPHQEPRFLLPTLLPLVLLFSDQVSIYSLSKLKFSRHFLFLAWQIWNLVCVFIFGFLHQGGVTRTMIRAHSYIESRPLLDDVHLFFTHMYTPPTFLLMRKLKTTGFTEDGRMYKFLRTVHSHDLGSSKSIKEIYSLMSSVHSSSQLTQKRDCEVVISLPASLTEELLQQKPSNVSLKLLDKIKWHVSMEHGPDLSLHDVVITPQCNQMCQFRIKLQQFSIDMYLVGYYNSSDQIPSQEKDDNDDDYDDEEEDGDIFEEEYEDLFEEEDYDTGQEHDEL